MDMGDILQNVGILRLIMPLLDELRDLITPGGLTKKNLREALEKAYDIALEIEPDLARISKATVLKTGTALFDLAMGVQEIVRATDMPARIALPGPDPEPLP